MTDIAELGKVDVAILCTPTREVQKHASAMLAAVSICTVDSFDIHSLIPQLRRDLGKIASQHGTVAVISAGWDPGSDSVVRTLMQAAAPKGVTYTNFGGMSMGPHRLRQIQTRSKGRTLHDHTPRHRHTPPHGICRT